MRGLTFSMCLLLGSAIAARAHFVFVVPEAGGADARVILSEDLKPAAEVDIGLIGGAQLKQRSAEGSESALQLVKAEHAYVAPLSGNGTRLIHGVVNLGVMQHGKSKPHLLIYYPKTIVGNAFDGKPVVGGETPVEIVPAGNPGALKLRLLVRGQPHPNSEITVILPDGKEKKVVTDQAGESEALEQKGRYGAWARYWEPSAGERDGKKYEEIRHYATLVVDAQPPATAVHSTASGSAAAQFATLPQATASFGAVAHEGWLYVYGGHIARTHSYSTAAVSGRFDRLKLSDRTTWEQLPSGPALQGMNLAAHGGKIYRIGGMAPRNKPGEAADTRSVADCARFDPASMKWEAIPPLPEPRSSHDVVVIGDKLIVVGGWTLRGADAPAWLDTLEVLDLSAGKLEWKSEKQPFKRRALIAYAYAGKMYVMGGLDEGEEMNREVAVFDPATAAWTKGPELPDGKWNAFAPAACVHDGELYVSVAEGSLYRLNEAKKQWEKSGAATPRIAHRAASDGKRILVIGGAAKGNNLDLVEAVSIETPLADGSARRN